MYPPFPPHGRSGRRAMRRSARYLSPSSAEPAAPVPPRHAPRVLDALTTRRLGQQNQVLRRLRALGVTVLATDLDPQLTIVIDRADAFRLRAISSCIVTRRTGGIDMVTVELDAVVGAVERGESCRDVVTQLAAVCAAMGLAGSILGPRGGGPAVRIVGHRRCSRLAEMVGTPPPEAPAGQFPQPMH